MCGKQLLDSIIVWDILKKISFLNQLILSFSIIDRVTAFFLFEAKYLNEVSYFMIQKQKLMDTIRNNLICQTQICSFLMTIQDNERLDKLVLMQQRLTSRDMSDDDYLGRVQNQINQVTMIILYHIVIRQHNKIKGRTRT